MGRRRFLFQPLDLILSIQLLSHYYMITLNAQVGVNPLINHRPISLFQHPTCRYSYTIGENGEMVAWDNENPVFQMCPSVNAEADRLLVLTAVRVRAVEKAQEVIRIITIHNDLRLRVWSQDDGLCLNVSTPELFQESIVALIAAPIESKFIIALAEECLYIVDLWLLKIMGKVSPKKESYARFKSGTISEDLKLKILDGNNRSYTIEVCRLFSQYFLDFGNYILDFDKIINEIDAVCKQVSSKPVLQQFYRKEPGPQKSLEKYKKILEQQNCEPLSNMIFSPDIIKDYPALVPLMAGEQPSISTLHYIGGSSLFLFIGTVQGKIWGIPMSIKSNEDLVLVCETSKVGSSVSYIRIFGGNLFVSWEDGWLSIYAVQNLCSFLEMAKINRTLQKKKSSEEEILTIGLEKLIVFQEKLSSFVKYSLPTYHHITGVVRGTFFFRLDRNEIIRYEEGGQKLIHYRGISEETKVYCVMLVQEYICICTNQGVEAYSNVGFQRNISYEDWIWADFECLEDITNTVEYRHSDMTQNISNSNGMLKFNSRWFFNLLDYYSHGESILTQTFGAPTKTNNEDFPGYYFMQKGEVEKAFHSRSNDNFSLVIKMKLNKVRKDNWNNAAFIVHGNLNAELDSFITQRANPKEILLKDFEFYQLVPWCEIPVPFLSKQLKHIGRRVVLRRRWTAQGVGKSFTIYLGTGRFKLSSRILAHEAISTIALLQCWVIKEPQVTDHMVEAVEYFARLTATLYGEGANIVLSKLAVSKCQHISKATINLLISKAHNSKYELHPLFEYYIMNQHHQVLSYNQTAWIVFLSLGLLYSLQKIEKEQVRSFVERIIACIKNLSNYEQKPHYLLTVMRVFNQGVHHWNHLLEKFGINELFFQLFKIFFSFDGLTTISQEDKKFNFCFASMDESLRRSIKQGIIKTIIYLTKEFPSEFHSILKAESTNQKIHTCYPASVIEILRQFIKSEKPQNHLVFYVELLLQCLSPMTPHLRKYVQKNALTTLQYLCTYSNVSFNQPSQRLSVKTQNHLYIYCLRTSTKWRTINLKQERGSGDAVVEMSPKGTYIALLSDKLRIWRLSSGFWSGVLGAFSQDWSYDASGKGLKWDQSESSITVINENPALNKVVKI